MRHSDSHMRSIQRRGQSGLLVTMAILIVLITAGIVLFMRMASDSTGDQRSRELHMVTERDFTITLPATGELTALRRIEVRNPLESRSVITYVIDEGETVQKGDVLVRLAEEEVRNQIIEAEDRLRAAENELVAAQANLEIRKSTRQSDLEAADLRIRLADLALASWREGQLLSQRQQLAMALETAEINYERLKRRMEESEALHEDGFISFDELERDRIALIEAEARLEQAKLDIEVYENYTLEQEKAQRESDLQQATEERTRTEQRHEAEIARAASNLERTEADLQARQERLADLQQQLENCVIRAPQDGLVVYASSLDRGRRDDDPPEVGMELRPNDLIIILPDISQMIADVKVNESLSGVVKRGQHAVVSIDAMPGVAVEGEVISIGVLAESGGWRDPNRRDYTVRIRLEPAPEHDLKPSMRCKAVVHIDDVHDAIAVPIQAVFREVGTSFVYVRNGGEYDQQAVTVGRTSEVWAEILDGLEGGEEVLLRAPRSNEVVNRTIRPDERDIDQNSTLPDALPEDERDQMFGDDAGDNGRPSDSPSADGDRPRRPGPNQGGSGPDGAQRGSGGGGGAAGDMDGENGATAAPNDADAPDAPDATEATGDAVDPADSEPQPEQTTNESPA